MVLISNLIIIYFFDKIKSRNFKLKLLDSFIDNNIYFCYHSFRKKSCNCFWCLFLQITRFTIILYYSLEDYTRYCVLTFGKLTE